MDLGSEALANEPARGSVLVAFLGFVLLVVRAG